MVASFDPRAAGRASKLPTADNATAGDLPYSNNQGGFCNHPLVAFAWFQFDDDNACIQGQGLASMSGGKLLVLNNSSGYRIFLHQYSNGTGWSDCFDHGQAYFLYSRDQSALSYTITTNTSRCTSVGYGTSICSVIQPFSQSDGSSGDNCYHYKVTQYSGLKTPWNFLTNGTGYRVYLHQNANGSGWADCFDTNNVYDIIGTRDANPGNVQVTTNSSPCT